MYKYLAFGLKISSNVYLPELSELIFDEADVTIEYGICPNNLSKPLFTALRYEISENEFLLKVDDIANYYVASGEKIIICKNNKATDKEIKLFLYSSVFGALFHQRNMIPLHATTVVKNNKAIAFSGNSGAGKSSISLALIKQYGFKLISDDITIISGSDSKSMVYPGIPHMKIWADIMDEMNINKNDYENIREKIEKYKLPINADFNNNASPLAAICFLNSHNSDNFIFEQIKGAKKIVFFKGALYRSNFMKTKNANAEFFIKASHILNNLPVYSLTRPRAGLNVNDSAKTIIDNLSKYL